MTPHRVDRARRRVVGAIALALALTTVALVRAALTHPAAEGGSSAPPGSPALSLGRAHAAGFAPYPDASRPIFLLVLGSDARPGEVVDRSRSDAIHVVGIDFQRHRASVIDIPRDSWVQIPHHGYDKINAAMPLGGIPLTIETVEALTGIRFDYYTLTSFPGLVSMVDDIGGLRIRIPFDIHDPTDGGPPIARGVQTLRGREALAFARARHFVPGGDFGRTRDQGAMLIAALQQYRAEMATDPAAMLTWLGTFERNVQTDLSPGEVISLAYAAAQIPAVNVNNVALQGSTGYEGTQSVVYLDDHSNEVFRDIRTDGVVDGAT